VYPKKAEIQQWPVELPPKMHLTHDGLIELIYMPTGFMRINRKVFEAMDQNSKVPFYNDKQEGRIRAYFKTVIENEVYWGEDYWFCKIWHEMGGKAHIIPDITFGHTGPRTWVGNLSQWIGQNAQSIKSISDPSTSSAA